MNAIRTLCVLFLALLLTACSSELTVEEQEAVRTHQAAIEVIKAKQAELAAERDAVIEAENREINANYARARAIILEGYWRAFLKFLFAIALAFIGWVGYVAGVYVWQVRKRRLASQPVVSGDTGPTSEVDAVASPDEKRPRRRAA